MKKLLLIALTALSLGACSKTDETKTDASSTATPAAQNASIASASIAIPTARCEMCESTISDAVAGVDGVTEVKASSSSDIAEVKYDPAKTNLASLEAAITKVGYNANAAVRDSAAHAKLHECCQ